MTPTRSTPARTYLDWNATAPLVPAARAAMLAALDLVGNASSVHAEGRRARRLIEDAREQVAALVGARPSEVVFTSGGTEANNTLLAGGWDTIFVAGIEHDSVLAPARASGARIIDVPVGHDGVAEVAAIADRVLRGPGDLGRGLISLQYANNETGILQPVAATAAFARAHGLAMHTDAVQAVGRIAVDVAALGVDYLTLSAHKLGGPAGIGALVIRDGQSLPPLLVGGGQERRRRAGTENVAAIAGFGAAAAVATALVGSRARAHYPTCAALRDRLEREALAITPQAIVIGSGAPRLPNTTCLALPGRLAETLVIALDLAGIAVSAGAACSSGKVGASHVLAAMGLAPEIAGSAIRVSIGPTTTAADITRFLEAWRLIAGRRDAQRAVA